LQYNLLAGFPGEKKQWYLDMAKMIPKIVHLYPPDYNLFSVELHRFAPLFEKKSEFGIENFEIRPDYAYNFPATGVDTKKTGYFFSFDCESLIPKSEYEAPLKEAIAPWIKAHETNVTPS